MAGFSRCCVMLVLCPLKRVDHASDEKRDFEHGQCRSRTISPACSEGDVSDSSCSKDTLVFLRRKRSGRKTPGSVQTWAPRRIPPMWK
ncbi:hypothetical protein Mapa_010433 [Marchantia paleacea]|nr:hypothetical protein Mapa_010433 [Marchantia paleacea]